MKQDNEFEDWSHSTRSLSMPPRRRPVRGFALLILALVLLAALCYAAHTVREAYRVVFSS